MNQRELDLEMSDPADQAQADGEVAEVDSRNRLNDLSGTEWIAATKSFMFQKGLGSSHPHAQIERAHPAPFSFQDIQRLIEFFTKSGEVVLDPFSGVGSTSKAAALAGRSSVGIELEPLWHGLAEKRMKDELPAHANGKHDLLKGDCREVLTTLQPESVSFVVTSPPYWTILNKKPDHKAIERVNEGLALSYSDDPRDLGNVPSYKTFLATLVDIFSLCVNVLQCDRYMCVVVSDFRHGSKFYSFHSDLIQRLDGLRGSGWSLGLQGTKVLLQNHKSLKPYGYPFAYVENIHHQYILIFRKRSR